MVAAHGQSPTVEQVQAELGLTGDARAALLVRHLFERDPAAALSAIGAVVDDGVELKRFLRDVKEVLRAALLVAGGAGSSLDLGREEMEQAKELAELGGYDEVTRALKSFAEVDIGDGSTPLPLEAAAAGYIVQARERADSSASRPTPAAAASGEGSEAGVSPYAGPGEAAAAPVSGPGPSGLGRSRKRGGTGACRAHARSRL